jgi:hypothetical protein
MSQNTNYNMIHINLLIVVRIEKKKQNLRFNNQFSNQFNNTIQY